MPWLEALARIVMAQLLLSAGDRNAGEAQLRAAEALAQAPRQSASADDGLARHGGMRTLGRDDAGAFVPLQAGLGLARELGIRHVPAVRPALLGSVCAEALRRGVGIEAARTLISAGRLVPPAEALRLRRWPWSFEVVTLGGFDLRRAGEPVEFSAKGPGRPVELLKVLIALGGQNVRIEQLADALWPRVDADYAHKSFTATLHRLRRIVGTDDALKLRDGRLSLNPSLFWLDTWALEPLFAAIDEGFARAGVARRRSVAACSARRPARAL
jgi:hypothetical protein